MYKHAKTATHKGWVGARRKKRRMLLVIWGKSDKTQESSNSTERCDFVDLFIETSLPWGSVMGEVPRLMKIQKNFASHCSELHLKCKRQ